MLNWSAWCLLSSFSWNRQLFSFAEFFGSVCQEVWDVLGFFQQTPVTYTWLFYTLRLLHFMTVLSDVTLIIQRDSIQSPVCFSGNCKGMLNAIRLTHTECDFKFSVSRVLGCHIYVDWLFMSFDGMKKCLLSHFGSLMSVTWFASVSKNPQPLFWSCIPLSSSP